MGILEILTLIADTVPAVTSLLDGLHIAQNSGLPGAVETVASALPSVTALMNMFTQIKNQTEADHPEVWAAVRTRYENASSKFDQLKAAADAANAANHP